jgi:hypothetical protein
MSLYLVKGRTGYRGHDYGQVFEAVLEERAEERALSRGNIELVERSTPSLKPGSYRMPRKR